MARLFRRMDPAAYIAAVELGLKVLEGIVKVIVAAVQLPKEIQRHRLGLIRAVAQLRALRQRTVNHLLLPHIEEIQAAANEYQEAIQNVSDRGASLGVLNKARFIPKLLFALADQSKLNKAYEVIEKALSALLVSETLAPTAKVEMQIQDPAAASLWLEHFDVEVRHWAPFSALRNTHFLSP